MYVRKSYKLLELAKNVFGDIVEDAWISTWKDDEQEAKEKLEDEERDVCGGSFFFDLSTEPYFIKFSNGKIVKFSISEWGDITLVRNSKFDFYEGHVYDE